MLPYCLNCRKNRKSKNPKFVRTENESVMLLSKSEVCDSKKSKFVKQKEDSGLLSGIGIMKSLNKIPFLGPLLF